MYQPLRPLPPPDQPVAGSAPPSFPYAQYWQQLDIFVRSILASVPNQQTANYVLQAGDQAGIVEMNAGGANTLTVPLNATVPFPIGTTIEVSQIGAGATTIAAAAGVTIHNRSGLNLAGQFAVAFLYKRGTDEWVAYGDLN